MELSKCYFGATFVVPVAILSVKPGRDHLSLLTGVFR